MELLVDCLRVAAFVAWLGFIITYSAFADWWKSAIGRNVFGTGLLLTGVFGLVVLSTFYPGFIGRAWVQAVIYSSAAYLGLQRAVQVVKAQREHKRLLLKDVPGVD